MMPLYAYLAGPDVFLANGKQVLDEKSDLCRSHGFEPITPLDSGLSLDDFSSPQEAGMAIYLNNLAAMQKANLAFANVTPFRGPSADAGTVYEVGLMHGLGKSVFAYGASGQLYADRVNESPFSGATPGVDRAGHIIEQFDLSDNLMIPCGIEHFDGVTVVRATNEDALHAPDAFLRALIAAERAFAERTK